MKENIGEVSAYFPKQGDSRSYYRKIGNLFREMRDDGSERLTIKIDMVPIGNHWEGWCNIFEPFNPDKKGTGSSPKIQKPKNSGHASDDDIPF